MKFTIVFSTLLAAITAVSGLAVPDVESRTDVVTADKIVEVLTIVPRARLGPKANKAWAGLSGSDLRFYKLTMWYPSINEYYLHNLKDYLQLGPAGNREANIQVQLRAASRLKFPYTRSLHARAGAWPGLKPEP
ncbi:hypothetical protein B0H11DRAFT_1899347 [Mycena galericulata]|nr:hypothetical protein B0H11DRAFT_1899347 [Mycena galericulata]